MRHYKREQKNKTTQNKQKNKKQKTKKRSEPLIAALEEVVKISDIIYESYQQGSSVQTSCYQMEALNLTKNQSPQVFLKRTCLNNNCWSLNIKIFRRTFCQSAPQQLKAAKVSTK